MAQPNFFILGAPKCGTTSLWRALRDHPDVYMAEPKEPRFFDLNYARGVAHYLADHFGGHRGERAVGEASPMYLSLPYVPERLQRHFPDARLIALVRDPVERAHSAWWMHHSAGREDLSFPQAVEENLERIRAGVRFEGPAGEYLWRRNAEWIARHGKLLFRTYVDAGYYAEGISRYLALFPRDRLLVLRFEDLVRRGTASLRIVCGFLGVEPEPEASVPHGNPSLGRGWPAFAKRWGRNVASLLPDSASRGLQAAAARLSTGRPPVEPETRSKLEEHYAGHNDLPAAVITRVE